MIQRCPGPLFPPPSTLSSRRRPKLIFSGAKTSLAEKELRVNSGSLTEDGRERGRGRGGTQGGRACATGSLCGMTSLRLSRNKGNFPLRSSEGDGGTKRARVGASRRNRRGRRLGCVGSNTNSGGTPSPVDKETRHSLNHPSHFLYLLFTPVEGHSHGLSRRVRAPKPVEGPRRQIPVSQGTHRTKGGYPEPHYVAPLGNTRYSGMSRSHYHDHRPIAYSRRVKSGTTSPQLRPCVTVLSGTPPVGLSQPEDTKGSRVGGR